MRLTYSCGRSWCALCLLGSLRAGVALFSFVRPRCLRRPMSSGLGCLGPWRLVAPPPPPSFFLLFSSFSFCLLSLFPLILFFFLVFFCFPRLFLAFFLFFYFFFNLCAPLLSVAFRVFRFGVLGPWRLVVPPPCLPPFVFFSSFLPVCFFFFLLFSPAVPCRWCGAGVVCVSWAAGFAGVCFSGDVPVVALCAVLSRPSGAGWCCVVLSVVFGCLLLGLAVLCCLLVGAGVLYRWCRPCLAAWLAALQFGVVCLGALLPCVVFCGAVLSCGGVLSCSAVSLRPCLCLLFVSCRCASAVCVLGCRAVRSLSSRPCVVLCRAVLVPLRCLRCSWCLVLFVTGQLVSLPVCGGPLVALVAWYCRLAVCVGLGIRVWPRLPSLGGLPVVSCSPCLLSCGAVVPCCCFCFALLVALVFCFPLKIYRKTRKNGFSVFKKN